MYTILPKKYFCKDNFCCYKIYTILPKIYLSMNQGGRSCAKARRAFAEKAGLGRKFKALTWAIWRDIKICCDLHNFWKTWGKKCLFGDKNSVSWARSALLNHIYCISYWIRFANLQLSAKTTNWRGNRFLPKKNFPRRKAANFCHPGLNELHPSNVSMDSYEWWSYQVYLFGFIWIEVGAK